MSTKAAERLAHAVTARRLELELTQLDVWQAGGPSNTTLTAIENAKREVLARTTARKLDRGLRWEDGSARRVWNGDGEPRTLDVVSSFADEVRRSNLSPGAKEWALRRAREDEEARSLGGDDPRSDLKGGRSSAENPHEGPLT